MFEKQKYLGYLSGTRKSDGTINEYISILEKFHEFIDGYRNENSGFSDFSNFSNFSDMAAVEAYFETYNVPHMYSAFKGVMQCLKEYSDYLIKNSEDSELLSTANAIHETFANRFKKKAVDFTVSRKKLILPIPDDALIDFKHLNGLDNSEFVSAFRELQNLIVAIYNEIEASPFEWGFPDSEQSYGYYHRAADFLFGFVRSGKYNNGVLTVDAKAFAEDVDIKKHKKRELVIKGLENFGFIIEDFSRKYKSFMVSFPDNNDLLHGLNSYVNALYENDFKWITDEKYPCYWTLSRHKYSFSYRYIERPDLQKHELPFLIELDYSSEKGKEALMFVHAEASKYGYIIDAKKPLSQMFHNSVIFKNGDKPALFIGENQIQFWHGGDFYRGITMNVFFKNIFIIEKEKEKQKMDNLISRFPDVFKDISEEIRMRRSFSGKWLWFEDLDIENVKDILEMYIIENMLT